MALPKQRIAISISFFLVIILLYKILSPSPFFLPGYIEGRFTYIAPTQAGIVTDIMVKSGDLVDENQALLKQDPMPQQENVQVKKHQLESAQAKLDDLGKARRPEEIKALEAAVEQAKADLVYAQAEYNRSQELIKRHAVSKDQLQREYSTFKKLQARIIELNAQLELGKLPAREDQIISAQKDVEAAKNSLKSEEWSLDQKTIKTQKSGKVIDIYVRTGDYLAPGSPAIQFLTPDQIFVNVYVPQDKINTLKTGQKISFHVDGDPTWHKATITYISPTAEYTPPVLYTESARQKYVYLIRATPDDSSFSYHPGQPIDIDITAHD